MVLANVFSVSNCWCIESVLTHTSISDVPKSMLLFSSCLVPECIPFIYTLYPWSGVQIVSVDVYLCSTEFGHCVFSTVECIPLGFLVQFWVHFQIFFYCWRSMCGQMFVMKWIVTGLFECAGVRHHLHHINFSVKGSPWVSGMLYMHTYILSGLTTEMFLLYFLLLYFIVARVISKQRSYFHC